MIARATQIGRLERGVDDGAAQDAGRGDLSGDEPRQVGRPVPDKLHPLQIERLELQVEVDLSGADSQLVVQQIRHGEGCPHIVVSRSMPLGALTETRLVQRPSL